MPKNFNPNTEIPDLAGKVVVVTGGAFKSLLKYRIFANKLPGNAGLGAETIRRLAEHNPNRIFLCARTPAKAEELISDIQKQKSFVHIETVLFDLSSLESAKAAAKTILSRTERLDLLFLNAGVSGTSPELTKDGYEWQFGVNYLAHVLFAQMLMPIMLRTSRVEKSDVRVISVASEAAKMFAPSEGLVLKDVRTDMRSYGGMTRYGHSKLANILFAKRLAQLYPSIKSIALHPGLVKSENQSKATDAGWFGYLWKPLLIFTGVTVEEGTKNQLWAATSKDAQSGKFYLPIGKEDEGGKYGSDHNAMHELWNWTERELATHGSPGWPAPDQH